MVGLSITIDDCESLTEPVTRVDFDYLIIFGLKTAMLESKRPLIVIVVRLKLCS